MRTTVDLPGGLLEDLARLTGATKKKDALRIALEDYVRNKRIQALLAAPGAIDIEYVRPAMEEAELREHEAPSAGAVTHPTRLANVAERRKRYR